ncbi:unnamed protein product [Prunus armeniaca]
MDLLQGCTVMEATGSCGYKEDYRALSWDNTGHVAMREVAISFVMLRSGGSG